MYGYDEQEKNTCDLCDTSFKYESFLWCHMLTEIFFILMFVLKVTIWQLYKSQTMGKLGKFPCGICSHSAKWHVASFDIVPKITEPVGAWKLFLHYKFKKTGLSECMKCIFTQNAVTNLSGHDYVPMNGLTYLGEKYES